MGKNTGIERYAHLMADWASSVIVAPGTNKFRDAEDVPLQARKQFDDVFLRFSAIYTCIENLDLCMKFIQARRPRRKDIRLDQYLSYHIAAYIQEMYILSERLEQYATLMMRRKKRSTSDAEVKKRFDALIARMRKALNNIVHARGSHVHDRPFDDQSLEPLSTYALLGQFNQKFSDLAAREYRISKRVWVARLTANKVELDKLVDLYFDFMHAELVPSWAEMLPNNSFKPK